jgi:hypothetical protein
VREHHQEHGDGTQALKVGACAQRRHRGCSRGPWWSRRHEQILVGVASRAAE